MIKQVMVLGATENFGSKIARGLAKANIPLIITGRQEKNLTSIRLYPTTISCFIFAGNCI